ncbi:MAG: alkaline phosphatase family protein [Deltaproteobacteria bacterium]|nr:alkaline phosphatase family protein [Deltaproteobacteria bacterium]
MDFHPTLAAIHRETAPLLHPGQAGVYTPHPQRNITAIMAHILALLDRPTLGAGVLDAALPPGSPRKARRVLLLTIDSLGFKELAASRLLAGLYGPYGCWLTSVFPSVTSAALTAIYQGLSPARHGILGHTIYKDFGMVDTLTMKPKGGGKSIREGGFAKHRWRWEPGLMETPAAQGLGSAILVNQNIAGSGLSQFAYKGIPIVPFAETLEALDKAARMVSGPTAFASVYLAGVDYLIHAYGGTSSQVAMAIHQIEEDLCWMVNQMAPEVVAETTLVIAADHGQCDITEKIPLPLPFLDWAQANLRGLGFSGRAMHVYLNPQSNPLKPEEVTSRLKELVGDKGWVMPFSEAGLLAGGGAAEAPQQTRIRESLGDWVVVLHPGINWDKTGTVYHNPKYSSPVVSQHGGLSWDEMFVPLISAPLGAVPRGGTL